MPDVSRRKCCLVPALENLPHGLGQEVHVFPPAGEAYQPDPSDFSLHGSESSGDVEAIVIIAKARPDGRAFDAVGNAERAQVIQAVLSRNKEFQPEYFHILPQRYCGIAWWRKQPSSATSSRTSSNRFAETIMAGRVAGVCGGRPSP